MGTRSNLPSWLGDTSIPERRSTRYEWLRRLSPSEGWTTFVLVAAMLHVVGWSVADAGWVEIPALRTIMFIAAVTGLLLAKVRAPAVLLHVLGLAVGFVFVAWAASSLMETGSFIDRVYEMWRRLREWYDAAASGGISRDLLPFSLMLMTMGWLLAYFSSWSIFRSRNVWIPVVLAGTAVLTNLSFLPGQYAYWFFLFTGLAMLLVVRMGVLKSHDMWKLQGVRFNLSSGWATMGSAVVIALVGVIVAASVPDYSPVDRTLARLWREGRAPLTATEDHFSRLFSGVTSKKDRPGRFFGDALPFQGAISFGGEVVFWAGSDYPSYWLSQTYSQYTPEGWLSGETQSLEAGPEVLAPPRGDVLDRIPVEQSIQLNFSTDNLLSGGGLEWVSREAELSMLAPKKFEVEIADAGKDIELPEDIRELASTLRGRFEEGQEEGFIEAAVTRMLPDDLVLTEAHYLVESDSDEEERKLKSVTLARKDPISPEIVAWRFADEVPKEDAYFMTSYVSVATDDSLRAAGEDYSTHITDHYLQLPASMPQRVRDLAESVTQGAETPLDKAQAIQGFLRGTDFTYSQDIDAPPADSDGVDHFLFESRTGYSDYFASSMAVMLRAVGIPSRLAAGYAPGQYHEESGLRFIRDSDSHGWVQVYFPEYGWIDFEPTPEWPVHARDLSDEETEGLGESSFTGSGFTLDDLDELLGLEDLEQGAGSSFLGLPTVTDSRFNPLRYLVPLAIIAGVVFVLLLIARLIWAASLLRTPPVERPYAKMGRLGALAGVKRFLHATPLEYAAAVASGSPKITAAAYKIGRAFARSRYGGSQPGQEEQEELETAWRSMRFSLASRALGRLVPTWSRAES